MTEDENEKVPLFQKWSHWYWFLLIWLALLIGLFALFTKTFA